MEHLKMILEKYLPANKSKKTIDIFYFSDPDNLATLLTFNV